MWYKHKIDMIVINILFISYTLLIEYILIAVILLCLNYPGTITVNISHEFNPYCWWFWYNLVIFQETKNKVLQLHYYNYTLLNWYSII